MAKRLKLDGFLLAEDLERSLVERFADTVMLAAKLPAARRADVEEAPTFFARDDELVCTDGITGSTYSEPWDGSRASALAFAERSGEDTAWLIRETPYYAWLRASR